MRYWPLPRSSLISRPRQVVQARFEPGRHVAALIIHRPPRPADLIDRQGVPGGPRQKGNRATCASSDIIPACSTSHEVPAGRDHGAASYLSWMRQVSAILAALLLAGCSGSHASPASTGGGSSATATVSVARHILWKPLLTLDALGEFRTRCVGKRFAVSFTSGNVATESVGVHLDGVRQKAVTLQPGEMRSIPLQRVRVELWRISQATEPQTIRAMVKISPARCPYGIPNTRVLYGTASYNSGTG